MPDKIEQLVEIRGLRLRVKKARKIRKLRQAQEALTLLQKQ
ncbi:MAG: hypothetical protein ACE5J0_02570 [Candidatus Paceibacterales bacterium]